MPLEKFMNIFWKICNSEGKKGGEFLLLLSLN